MKRDNWPVEKYGIRPAGPPDHCFYCGEPMGNTHDEECVIRQRTVVVKATAQITVSVPEFYTGEQVTQLYTEKWMSFNLDWLIEQLNNYQGWTFADISLEYIREATEKDEQHSQLFVKELPT